MTLFAGLMLAALALANNGQAAIETPPPPSVWSDKADYAPGEEVTLSGANWAPGESVHIRVNDDEGETWRRDVDVTADESGAISDQFNLPMAFVAVYSVTATGSSSGTATWTFTDAVQTSTTLASNLNPSNVGDSVTFTATVTCSVTCTFPAGSSVDFVENAGSSCNGGTTLGSNSTLTGTGLSRQATFATSTLSAGTHLIRACYVTTATSGNNTQKSNSDPLSQVVNGNAAPVCNNGSATTTEDTAVAANLGCTDADGNTLSYSIVSGPSSGVLSGTGAGRTYTPNANFNGTDSFTFKANDGTVDSNVVTFDITVTAVNDAPSCSEVSLTTDEDTPGDANPDCTDIDSASLSYAIVGAASHGTASVVAGKLHYVPNANYNGSDSFAYKANDGALDSNTATVSVTVNAVNDAPSCTDGSATTDEDTPKAITFACTDVDSASLTYSVVSGSSHGSVTGGTGANRTYSPALNYNGTDSFTFQASDGSLDGNVAAFDLTINAVDDDPTVTRDDASVTLDEGDTATNSGTYDDVDGDTVTLSASVGTVTANGDGTWDWSYSTSDGPDQSQAVTITASDGSPPNATVAFALTVNNVAPVVTAAADQSSDEGDSHSFSLGSFTDPGDDGPWSVDVDWGDGTGHATFTAASAGALPAKSHTYADGPNDYVVSVTVSEAGTAPTPSDSDSFAVHVNNVAPTVEFTTAPSSAFEGDTKTYQYTYSDPGADTINFASGYPSCGDHGSLVGSPTISSPGSFQCSFPEGPETTNVAIRVTDGDDFSADVQDVNIVEVTIANAAPTATFGDDGPVDEGSSVTVSFTNQSDPSAGDTAAGFHYAYSCDGSPLGSTPYASSGTSASKNCKFGDNGDYTVKGRIIDRNDGYTTYDTAVHVRNVDPTASNPSFTFDPVLGTATAGFDASDVGWLDSLASSFFKWSIDSGNRPASLLGVENVEPFATAHASDTRALTVGCYNLTVTGVAMDDDGDQSSPLAIYSNSATSVYARGFRPPIMDNERNIVKYGNVVPIKVLLTNPCTGASVTSLSLYITTVQGAGSEVIESTNTVAESVSSADSGSQMRVADGMYIYNLATKSLTQNKDYTVRVRVGAVDGPIILTAVLQPKK